MKLYTLIVDEFLSDFNAARQWLVSTEFKDFKSPTDSVVYPCISTELPVWIQQEVQDKLSILLDYPVEINTLFSRLMPEGVEAPNKVHNDLTMGRYSLMLYMNKLDDCVEGTSLMRHKATGIDRAPSTDEALDRVRQDSNNLDAWETVLTCEMYPNRAFIFPAELMHKAGPVEGFGQTTNSARAVITAFFN